ncbi:S-adenosyl-L-methionine-dependent methyltransferase [Favolaschia claudopus]|uniref:S-adenosyl-L-methionine-dependent methyltransferase n=1 Tax=Favolaschia claudopus TaxID=2862362 RepID=A0AAW0CWZ8_9AGAR
MPSELRQLVNLLSSAVDTVDGIYEKENATFPALDKPWNPKAPNEILGQSAEVAAAKMILVAAAEQLMATVREPYVALIRTGDGMTMLACLRTLSELNVAEILREAGPQGLNVNEIAAPSKVNPDLLARMLRLLATNHIFTEVSPNVFANNRISSALDKGKPSAELFAKPDERLQGASPVAALVEMFGDDLAKSFSHLTESIQLDPTGATSPMRLAFNVPADQGLFPWMMRPENKKRAERFTIAMHSDSSREVAMGAIYNGFDWGLLPADGTIVDVGSGMGVNGLTIAKKYPGLRVVNQDFAAVVEKAKAHWQEHLPSHIEKGLVEFQTHDFFTPQPITTASAFILRHITHDWSDDQNVQILRRLRDASSPQTYLILIEHVVPSIAEESDEVKKIEGATREKAPEPLLGNFGAAASSIYARDMLLHFLGGKERTVANFVEVFDKAGWKLVRIHRIPGLEQCHVVGVPA